MSLRRYVSLMHGLNYGMTAAPDTAPPEKPQMSSKEDIKRFFGGAIRVTPSEVSDGG